MAFKQIQLRGRPLAAHKIIVAPDFMSRTVLVADTWDYVTMWLRRQGRDEALFYWEQARHFFEASKNLPNTSSPLTLYYCFLNAVNALLNLHGVSSNRHGVTGKSGPGRKTSLANEIVTLQKGGTLAELRRYLTEPAGRFVYSLKDLFYNLPYIHRAYKLTYASRPELFIPIRNPRFVRKDASSEAWFCAEVEDRYATAHTLNKLEGFERDLGVQESFTIRMADRFKWVRSRAAEEANKTRLINYHRKVRKTLYYIQGPTRLWYLKRSNSEGVIKLSSLTITIAAMHRLSEMARYAPIVLANHFKCRHNWLVSEFIATARTQFIDEISSEITGQEFMIPGRKGVT